MQKENYYRLSFPSRSVNESFARMTVSAFCMQFDPTIEQINDIKTAVSEAVTNCVVHAYPDSIGTVYITAIIKNGILKITVKDKGIGIPDITKAMEPMYTTDMNSDIEELSKSGYMVLDEPMEAVAIGGKKVCFLFSANSGMIELLEATE